MKWFDSFYKGSTKSRLAGMAVIAGIVIALLFVFKPFSQTASPGTGGETSPAGDASGGPAGAGGRPVPGRRPTAGGTAPKSRTTVLLIGVDGDSFHGVRSDSLILATFHPPENRVEMLSIPRDSYVWIDEVGYWDKISHAYALAPRGKNAEAAMAAVSELLAVPVENYAVINMAGFQQLVDIMGGIDVYIEKDLSFGLRQGHQRMDGETALKYARFRRDIEGDFGRTRRQQQLLAALLTEALKIDNLGRIGKLASEVRNHIKTNLSFSDMLRMGLAGRRLKSDSITGSTLTGTNRMMGGIYYLEVDLVEARTAAHRQVFGREPDEAFVAEAREYAGLVQEVVEAETARLARVAAKEPAEEEDEGVPPHESPGGSGEGGDGAGEAGGGEAGGGDGADESRDPEPRGDDPHGRGPGGGADGGGDDGDDGSGGDGGDGGDDGDGGADGNSGDGGGAGADEGGGDGGGGGDGEGHGSDESRGADVP